ncbi:MAG: glycine dehydrogenase (aminomethyl-transferring), partial [Alphaproteobacteria bacterium]|nr:glycine dehydrogenase (aminomethyl-transferring) [Alphaproteobacteria bacterium]
MADDRRRLEELEQRDDFVARHIGPRETDVEAMLETVGLASLGDLIARAVPDAIRNEAPLDLPRSRSEPDVLAELRHLAAANQPLKSYIGAGYYDCVTPPVILRNVMENPGWY